MTPLEKIIREEIDRNGPMPIDRYMSLCLSHPQYGYYMNRDPLGHEGDFITAPEISQIFGELIGLWLAHCWGELGRPSSINLVELGPGRGTLMSDILRVAKVVPGFTEALNIWMVETSPVLKSLQAQKIKNAVWVDDVREVTEAPTLLIANEFFDALPTHQYQRVGDVWLERVVRPKGEKLGFGLRKTEQTNFSPHLPDGTIVERNPASLGVVDELNRLISFGGAALIVDYGAKEGSGDTLQAVTKHGYVDPLHAPGEADLTTHVDFGSLIEQCNDILHTNLTTQRDFLIQMGIGSRAEFLAKNKAPETQKEIASALLRLTGVEEMGELFKVLAITNGIENVVGFTT